MPLSAEGRARLAESMRRRWRDPDHRARASAATSKRFKGTPLRPEHRAKISTALKGRPGKPHTEETKRRISAINQSHPQRAMRSAALKARFADLEWKAKWRLAVSLAQKRRFQHEDQRTIAAEYGRRAWQGPEKMSAMLASLAKGRQTRWSGPENQKHRERVGAQARQLHAAGKFGAQKGDTHSESWKRGQSLRSKQQWQDPVFATRVISALKQNVNRSQQRPNGLERVVMAYLDGHYPEEWFYNRGATVVDGLVPDFARTDGALVALDIFGDYWHRHDTAAIRIGRFAARGWTLAIVWEREFRADPDAVAHRLSAAFTAATMQDAAAGKPA